MSIDEQQFYADKFYMDNGPCCSGCDWWHGWSSIIGECRRSAPVPASERYCMLNIVRLHDLPQGESGHILTPREHHCGEFKDEFDWQSLPLTYLKRIGCKK